jgi:hypothetical protein
MKKAVFLLLFLLIVSISIASSPITNFNVTEQGRDVKITWEMLDQNGVRFFDVERSASNQDQYTKLNPTPIYPNGSGQYTFFDQSLYKYDEAVVFYRIAVIDLAGNTTYSESRPLGKLSNIVRRTWGSLKSMFR